MKKISFVSTIMFVLFSAQNISAQNFLTETAELAVEVFYSFAEEDLPKVEEKVEGGDKVWSSKKTKNGISFEKGALVGQPANWFSVKSDLATISYLKSSSTILLQTNGKIWGLKKKWTGWVITRNTELFESDKKKALD